MGVWFLVGFLCFFSISSYADIASSTQLNEVDVIGKLDQARDSIQPSLGATDYNITSDQIDDQSQGNNAAFNQVLLRSPGVAEDSFGQLHVRGEHANLQYRINDVLLPEGLTGFGEELDTRFVDNISLIDGSLPAQYGFHTAGIVDIHTKSGTFTNGGDVSIYGGSQKELTPSFTYGGSGKGGINYFVTGSYLEDTLGIENPTDATSAIHDQTQQGKMFAYVSKIIDDTSRLNIMLSASHSDFQIPNSPAGSPFTDTAGNPLPLPSIDSANVNDRQIEQNFYGVVAYQKAEDKLNYQVSAFTRFSEVNYLPDPVGDLEFNGVATTINDSILTNGVELDGSYELNDNHTLRAGSMLTISDAINKNSSLVFPDSGAGVSGPEASINVNNQKQGEQYGLYLEDEWKVTDRLTINYGARFDQAYQYLNESQLSPRINAVYEVNKDTKVHAGYARYFTPPPLELEQNANPAIFDNTTNAAEVDMNSPSRAERANYYDAGVTHYFLPELQAGLDSYYKTAVDQLDDGQFGAAPIVTPFNYKQGRVYGTEFTINYKKGGFSGYANAAYSRALGRQIVSNQFQFGQDDLNYISDHWIHLDHDQSLTVSAGLAYEFDNSKIYADLLFGSGLREDGDTPNGKRVGSYTPINMGIEHTFKINVKNDIKVRFDVVNVFDEVYELRNGTGVGVGAPQFGPRRGFLRRDVLGFLRMQTIWIGLIGSLLIHAILFSFPGITFIKHAQYSVKPSTQMVEVSIEERKVSENTIQKEGELINFSGKVNKVPEVKQNANPGSFQNPAPEYPEFARQMRQEGLVMLSVDVNVRGEPLHIEILHSSGHRLLDQAAVKAVRNWKFQPGSIGNFFVESTATVPIRFRLEK